MGAGFDSFAVVQEQNAAERISLHRQHLRACNSIRSRNIHLEVSFNPTQGNSSNTEEPRHLYTV